MAKIALIVLGVLIAASGVLALFPAIGMTTPLWGAIVKIVVGAIAVAIGCCGCCKKA